MVLMSQTANANTRPAPTVRPLAPGLSRVKLTSAVALSDMGLFGDMHSELDVSFASAQHLVSHRLAIWVIRNDGYTDSQPPEVIPVTEPEPDSPVTEESEEVKRPYGNASKSEWIKYAVSADHDLTRERAETMTKADLISRYGERL